MKNTIFYIVSVGLSFYAGNKLMPAKTKVVTKTVKVKSNECTETVNKLREEKKFCIKEYDNLVDKANKEIENLKAEVDSCEDKYFRYIESPHENLEPETVEEKDPVQDFRYRE